MRKNLSIWLSLSVVMLTTHLTAQEVWDLRRCVEYARENNIQVRQQHLQALDAELTYKNNKYSQLPTLNGNIQGGWNFGRSVDQVNYTYTNMSFFQTNNGLSSNVVLFNWFSRTNTTAASRFSAEAERMHEEKIKNDITLNVANLYLQVLLNIQTAQITETRFKQSEAQHDNTRKQVDAGALPELNAVELEAQMRMDSANWIEAKTNIELSILNLKNALNLQADEPFVVETPPVESIPLDNILEASPADIYNQAIEALPQFRGNELRLQSANKMYKAAYGQLFPTISLYGQLNTLARSKVTEGYGAFRDINPIIGTVPSTMDEVIAINSFRQYDNFRNVNAMKQFGNNFSQNFGMSVNIPIFNGLNARTNLRRQKLNIERSELNIEQDKLNIKRDIYEAHQQALGTFEKYNASVKSVESAQKAFDFATRRYEIGMLQTIQWINAQNTLAEAKLNAVIAQFNYVFRMKMLEFYKGQGIKL